MEWSSYMNIHDSTFMYALMVGRDCIIIGMTTLFSTWELISIRCRCSFLLSSNQITNYNIEGHILIAIIKYMHRHYWRVYTHILGLAQWRMQDFFFLWGGGGGGRGPAFWADKEKKSSTFVGPGGGGHTGPSKAIQINKTRSSHICWGICLFCPLPSAPPSTPIAN